MATSPYAGLQPTPSTSPNPNRGAKAPLGHDPNYYKYDPSGRRAYNVTGGTDSRNPRAYNYQDPLTPEQRARMDAARDKAYLQGLQVKQQVQARNEAMGYTNRPAPGQRVDNRFGFLPGGQHLTYNLNSGEILSDYNEGENVYDLYPMSIKPRPVASPGYIQPGTLRIAQSQWDKTWGAGNFIDPNQNNWQYSTPDQAWWEGQQNPFGPYNVLGGY